MTVTDTAPTAYARLMGTRRPASDSLPLDLEKPILVLKCVLVTIITLGILRELIIAQVGTETVLKDLRHFTLDAERNLTSWFESATMAASSLMLFLMAVLVRQRDGRNWFHWLLLGLIFMLMSIDEEVSFHEVSVAPLRNAFGLSDIFYYSWVLLATPLVIAVGLYFIPFLLRLRRETAIRFVIAGAVFVSGALGTEFILGHLATTSGMQTFAYVAVADLQECMEITGMTMFLIALLRHLAAEAPSLHIEFRQS